MRLREHELERHRRVLEAKDPLRRACHRRSLGGRGRHEQGGGGGGSFNPDALPLAIGLSTLGLTLEDSDTTVQTWTAAHGTLAGLALAAPAATNRPSYSAAGGTGGRPIVTFDGVDDVLTGLLTRGEAWGDCELGIVGRTLGNADNRYILAYDNTTGFRLTGWDITNTARFETRNPGGATSISISDPGAARAHISADWDGADQSVRFAGAVQDTDAATPTDYVDGNAVSLGASPSAAAPLNVEIQAWYIGARLTDTQRADLRAWLTTHTGISC